MKIDGNSEKINEVLVRGVDRVLPGKESLEKIMKEKRIRLYFGMDPTSPKIHLGHSLGLKKLQEFAELGHEAVLVIGTGTVLAGDPSLRIDARPLISRAEIEKNIKTWKKQAAKILDFSRIKIRYNSTWLFKLGFKDIVRIASNISAVKLFQREMFQTRIKRGDTIWTHEALYPLLQGYDSVALDVDLEIGGTDQIFNMLIGRELQQKMRKKEKFVLTWPLIFGTDGQPMSKTRGNCIWIEDTAEEMFGKTMSIPDQLIGDYFLLTHLSSKEIEKIKTDLRQKKVSPRNLKVELAREITAVYHGVKEAKKAERDFEKIFKEKKVPEKISKIKIRESSLGIIDLLVKTKLSPSRSEAKRLIMQGGVKINRKTEKDWQKIIEIKKGLIIQSGKRKFIELN